MAQEAMTLAAEGVSPTPFEIPGATGQFRIQVLNEDTTRGVVTSIVHLPPGGRIPAHRHEAGAEMHYVLEGDLVDAGQSHGPGTFLTHAAGVVHGPHESRGGARVLTVQHWQSHDGQFDFHLAETDAGTSPAGETRTAAGQRAAAEDSLGKGYG
jgi:quercetin dioxygenase-like cupin family protein